jgi:protein-S-isoprenylcysteine O-methyltransferase Ste14
MGWIPYAIIVIGLFLLGLVPVLVSIVRINPMLVVRSIWRDNLTPESARLVGILIIIAAFAGGLWAIISGIYLLKML